MGISTIRAPRSTTWAKICWSKTNASALRRNGTERSSSAEKAR
jgi:hypothetical protein